MKSNEKGEDLPHQAHHHLLVHLLQNKRNVNKKLKAKEKEKVDVIKNLNQSIRRVTITNITMIILMVILMADIMVVIEVNQALAQVNVKREDKSINNKKMRSVYRKYVTKWYKNLEETVKITNNMFLKEWTKDSGELPSNIVLTRT